MQRHVGSSTNLGPSMAADWHEYAVEIAMGRFAFAVDGKVVMNSTATPDFPVHDVPWYTILNFAVGGPWPDHVNSQTLFPVSTLVDYVRVVRGSN